jgi:DNA repair ATPase RecN
MITLQRLTLENFMNIESADLDFSSSYLNIFTGPNGAGKSSIIEAIAICFTERRRGDSFKDFIKHGATTATIHLEATYTQVPVIFDAEIVNKPGWAPFKRTIKYKGITYKNSECTPLLESFGLDYLQHIMFSLQGENNVVDLKPAERTKVLKRIFDFELKPQLDIIETRMAQDEQALLVAQTQFDTLSSREFSLQEEKEELSATQVKRYEMGLEEVERKLRDVEQKAFQASSIQKDIDSIDTRIGSLREQITTAQNSISTLTRDIANLEIDTKNYTATLNALESDEEVKAQIEEKLSTIDTLSTLISQNERLISEKQKALEANYPRLIELTTHIEAHKKGTCPTCGQQTHPESVPHMEEDKEQLANERMTLQSEQTALQQSKEESRRAVSRLENEISQYKQTLTNNSRTREQYKQFLTRMQSDITSHSQRTVELKNSIVSLEATLSELQRERERLIEAQQEVEVDVGQLYNDRARLKKILDDNNVVKALNIAIRQQNIKLLKEREQLDNQLQELIALQNGLAANLTHYRDAKRILSVDLPNYIIVKACSKLEKHINSFISNVKPGMVVRLLQSRRGVDFFYSPKGETTDVDEWMSTKMASGFERELLSTAWRVALAKAYSLDILMLDEIDSAASVQASEKMFQEIASLEGFEQLFIISHKPELVEIIQAETDRVSAYSVQDGIFTLQNY